MAAVDRDGVRIHYEAHGPSNGATPLLLTHGFSATCEMWSPNLAALSAGRRVLTWDLRGHGRSDAPDDASRYSHDLSLGDMAAVLDAADVKRAVLCGMSLGGYLSLAFRLLDPERVAGLLLVDTGPGFRRDADRAEWNAWVQRTADDLDAGGLAALGSSPEVRCAHHRSAAGLAHAARGIMAQRDAAVIESLPEVDVPTLVVVGGRDTPFLRAADYMAAKIPRARKLVVEGAGHAPNLERPDVFNHAATDFLDSI